MVPYIYTPRDHHNARTPEAYLEAHAAFLTKKAAHGRRERVHVSHVPCVARIDTGSWIIEGECGAGNATAPTWGFACCYACGAIHRAVRFPSRKTVEAIEHALLLRPRVANRFWLPERGDTLDTVIAENREQGVDE